MKLDYQTYRDKVQGCWEGKNIGGVLGAPFEGKRQLNYVDFYTQDLSCGIPANDDLDLQIIWLSAVEKFGRGVTASILGEYWLTFETANMGEYGIAKSNLRAGLEPPLSGVAENPLKTSNGSFIRSEIWACLAPGHPEIAARYAREDAIVDHEGEGVFAEVFFAAMESAAFVESDIRGLIDIGLSYIPEESATARGIRMAVECYERGIAPEEARLQLHNAMPGTFGISGLPNSRIPAVGGEGMEIGVEGFDAPENVAFMIAALLYGEYDFGKSLCTAVLFGEDTDCTAATLGALLGILSGSSGLPRKWKEPLNDKIETLCINRANWGVWVPRTCTELTERVCRIAPMFLGVELCDILSPGGLIFFCQEGKALFCEEADEWRINSNYLRETLPVKELCRMSPYVVQHVFPIFRMYVDYGGSFYFTREQRKKIKFTVVNGETMREPFWAKITLYCPPEVKIVGAREVVVSLNTLYGSKGEAEFEIEAEDCSTGRVDCIAEVSILGRHTSGAVRLTIFRAPR